MKEALLGAWRAMPKWIALPLAAASLLGLVHLVVTHGYSMRILSSYFDFELTAPAPPH